jgi:hypothetical protein
MSNQNAFYQACSCFTESIPISFHTRSLVILSIFNMHSVTIELNLFALDLNEFFLQTPFKLTSAFPKHLHRLFLHPVFSC